MTIMFMNVSGLLDVDLQYDINHVNMSSSIILHVVFSDMGLHRVGRHVNRMHDKL